MWTHAIKAEEYYGLSICTENLEYSVHIADDINRHSSPDNYSCELFERAIRIHKQQTHNSKGIEASFALRESMRQFINLYTARNGPLSNYGINTPRYQFDMDTLQQPNAAIFLHERSFDAAVALIKDLEERRDDNRVNVSLKVGVAVGKIQEKEHHPDLVQDVRRHLGAAPNEYIIIKAMSSLVKRNSIGDFTKFTKGDTCILAGGINLEEEWYVEIAELLKVNSANGQHVLVNGTYYVPGFENRQVALHEWTHTVKLLPRQYARMSVQPAKNILRKIILYPEPLNIEDPEFHLPADFDNLNVMQNLVVPVWPVVQDDLSVQGHGNQVWFCKVIEADNDQRRIIVRWFQERRPGVWSLTNQQDMINFQSILSRIQVEQVPGGFQIQ